MELINAASGLSYPTTSNQLHLGTKTDFREVSGKKGRSARDFL